MRYYGNKVSSSINHHMHIKEQDKDQTIFIKHNSWQSEEIIYRVPTKAQFILHELVSQIPLFWNYEEFILAYLKIKRYIKNYFKIKEKFMKVLAWKKKATSLLKTRFLVTLNLKERWKVVELKKYLKTGVKSRLFERKLKFWNLFENWKPENYLKIGVLKIKFKNWNFGN